MLKILLLTEPLRDRAGNADDAFLRAVWLYAMSIGMVFERVIASRKRLEEFGLPNFRPDLFMFLGTAPALAADALARSKAPAIFIPAPSLCAAKDVDRAIDGVRVTQVWLRSSYKAPKGLPQIVKLPSGTNDLSLSGAADGCLKKLGLRLPHSDRGATIARNLLSEVALESTVFNPHTRLLAVDVRVRTRIPPAFLHGEFQLDRASVPSVGSMTHSRGPAHVHLSGDAILPAGIDPAQARFAVIAWRQHIATVSLPVSAPVQHSGLIGLELGKNSDAGVFFWADDTRCRLHCGTRVTTIPDRAESGQARPYKATTSWPFNRPRLETDAVHGCGQSLTQLGEWSEPKAERSSRLSQMKDIHAGATAWIIGNGPSVQTEDLDRLEGRLTFCFNRFHLAYDRTILRPTYTVTADQQMIDDFGQSIVDKSAGTVFVASAKKPKLKGKHVWVRQLGVYPSLFSFDPQRLITPGGSSLYAAMQLGFFMGIRKFVLYGVDFQFTYDRQLGTMDPFRAARGDSNHFIANYRGGRGWAPPSFRNIASSFFGARLLMEANGGFVRNASRGGALELFERTDFDQAIAADFWTL